MAAMKIDVHNHFVVPEYTKLLLGRKGFPSMEPFEDGYLIHVSPMDTYVLPNGMFRLESRLEDMDATGVDLHVMSIIVPAGEVAHDPVLNVELAEAANEGLARIQRDHPNRFATMATLPLLDGAQSVRELDRAVNQLGLRSAMITSNVAGKALDSEDLWPVYARAEQLGVPLMIHPSWPVMAEHLQGWNMAVNLGFLFDSTAAMMRLILSGVMERYPNLTFILCHLGSTIPYVIGRLNRTGGPRSGNWGNNEKAPFDYFRRVYIDTVSRHRPAIVMAGQTMGTEKLLFGTDYPYGTIPPMIDDVMENDFTPDEKTAIMGGNAARLFNITD
ncbi:MAG: amidohydrolase family protein [Chloroflexi bacterium]|nr:amidohydrolase family protein [Chloroflexota bacterium]